MAIRLNQRWRPRGEGPAPSRRAGGHHDVLVVGPARSGTTWVGEVLGEAVGGRYVIEPDNVVEVPFAGRARAGLGSWAVLAAGVEAPSDYERLWDVALGARRKSARNALARRLYASVPEPDKVESLDPQRPSLAVRHRLALRLAQPGCVRGSGPRVVKSIDAVFALDWLLARYDLRVVLVRRHPLDVLASQWELFSEIEPCRYPNDRAVTARMERWRIPPSPSDDRFAERAWYVGFEMSAYQEAADSNPEIRVASHEALCADPLREFRRLVADVGLEWSPECEQYLHASNVAGTGYERKRVAAEEPGKWRTRLSDEQLHVARQTLRYFPIARLYDDLTD